MQKDCGDVDVAGKFRKILKRVFLFSAKNQNKCKPKYCPKQGVYFIIVP